MTKRLILICGEYRIGTKNARGEKKTFITEDIFDLKVFKYLNISQGDKAG